MGFHPIVIVTVAFLTSFFVFYNFIIPTILQPGCFVDSNACVRLSYYSYDNSVLVQIRDSGLWIWYNGDKVFVFGQPVGQLCENPDKYESAYVVNIHSGKKEGYKCVMNLDSVKDYYISKGVKKMNLIKYVGKNRDEFDIYALINYLAQKGVINV